MSRLIKCLILTFAALSVLGAGDKDKTPFKAAPASSYEYKLAVDGLLVAVQPFDNDELVKSAFGKLNPNQYSVLPVLVVMQNDSKKPLRLDNIKVELVLPNRDRVEATPASDVRYARAPKRPNMGNPLPFPRRVGKNPLDKPEIEERAFAAKVILPGESASGFFYFQTGYRGGSTFYLTGVKDAQSGQELFYFEIPLAR
ncbi:MAG: hypothetical protein SFV54_16765 [Bryobacteraceae bacterium]|nr:hypothetical protein [Bryobacteraceae bacterium]